MLTEWAHQRFGPVTGVWLTFLTLVTMFLYMIAELSAVGQVITALTGLDSLPAVIVECVVTTIYTTLGGFLTSFFTDNIQGAMIVLLIIICSVAIGVETNIDPTTIQDSGLLNSSLLGWQLLYIFPIAITFNDYFLAQFWLRTFSAKSDKALWIGCSIAAVVLFIFLLLIGFSGVVAVWAGVIEDLEADGPVAFFLLIAQLPAWVVGCVLVFAIALSTAVFDSYQSAMVSTASQNLFRNKLPLIYVRALVIVIIFPVVVLSLRAPDILQILLISDLVSAAAMPIMLLGMIPSFTFLHGFEVIVSGLGGFFTIFLFGLVYYQGDAYAAAQLLILEQGFYAGDWSAFGAFVAAPVGAILWGIAALLLRLTYVYIRDRRRGVPFSGFSSPTKDSTPLVDRNRPSAGEAGHFDA